MKYEQFLELLKNRVSVRSFTDESVSEEELLKICDAGRYAMSGGNSQPWEFLIIRSRETLEKIKCEYLSHEYEWTYYLEQMRLPEYRHNAFSFPEEDLAKNKERTGRVFDAPAMICLLYDPRKQFGSVLSARADMNDGSKSVLSCTMGHLSMTMQLACASLGLGSCRIDCNQQEGYRKILGYPEPVNLYCMLPIGHSVKQSHSTKRHELSELLHYESYDQTKIRNGSEILDYISGIRK